MSGEPSVLAARSVDDAASAGAPAPRGRVVSWSADPLAYGSDHEKATRRNFSARLAVLKGFDFVGEHDPASSHCSPLYFVPSDTVPDTATAQRLGIVDLHGLFGGVVPHPFVATKAISHAVPGDAGARPEGWSGTFAPRIASAVLKGFSSFSLADARWAGRCLLRHGPVRVKPVRGTGGRGQSVAFDAGALDSCLDAIAPDEIEAHGVVLEENLERPDTLSVGQVTVGDAVVSYHGRQRLTRDNRGEEVYGGSDLHLVRGGFDALCGLPGLAAELRLAIEQACSYHQAVLESYPGFFASRVNYDVAQGVGAGCVWRSGVLEQSWRLGGASGAEIAALEYFRERPDATHVRASTVEVYGDNARVPDGAIVHYQGVDSRVGALTKYALLTPNADAP